MEQVWAYLEKSLSEKDLVLFFGIIYQTLSFLPWAASGGNPSPSMRKKYARISKMAGDLADLIGPVQQPRLDLMHPDDSKAIRALLAEPISAVMELFKEDRTISHDIYDQLQKIEQAAMRVSKGFRQDGRWDKELKQDIFFRFPFTRKASSKKAPIWMFIAETASLLSAARFTEKRKYDSQLAQIATVVFNTKEPIHPEEVRKIRTRK